MKIKSITTHNFRSIKEAKFNPYDYTVLVGANNAGKSNVLTALRIFYEDGIKFSDNSDFPKFQTETTVKQPSPKLPVIHALRPLQEKI